MGLSTDFSTENKVDLVGAGSLWRPRIRVYHRSMRSFAAVLCALFVLAAGDAQAGTKRDARHKIVRALLDAAGKLKEATHAA